MIALVLAFLFPGMGKAQEVLQPPLVVNCSQPRDDDFGELEERGEREQGVRNLRYLPDRPYREHRGYGFESGEGFFQWFAASWGRPEGELFRSGRIDPESYRFRIPPGDYIVHLGFCELLVHTEGRRIFDVLVQDEKFVEDLDPFALAGFGQAFRIPCRARVRGDAGLTIVFRRENASPAPPLINAIWIYPGPERPEKPEPPLEFRGYGSYGMNVLLWSHPQGISITGYLIERRGPGSERIQPLLDNPTPLARWIDREVEPGEMYQYRIRSADLAGGRSEFTEPVSLVPRSIDESTLPVYSIEVSPESLTYMLSQVNEDRNVPGNFTFKGRHHPVQLRLRGASTRFAPKKSYRIQFTGKSPFRRDVIYLKAEPADFTLQQEKISCDVYAALGLPVSQASFVNLVVNGRYQGVYLDIEPIRDPFKVRAGLHPRTTLLRAHTFQHLDGDEGYGKLRGKAGSTEELSEFIRRLNRVERGEFESLIRSATDWKKVLDYLVAAQLCHRAETEADDYFFYRERLTGKWGLIPWDHNNGNFGLMGYQRGLREPHRGLFTQSIQDVGWRGSWWFVLPSRIFQHPGFLGEYLDRLESATRDYLLSGKVDGLIEKNYEELREEGILDPHRWPPWGEDPFPESNRELKNYVRRHGRRLLRLIEEERSRKPPSLVINEFAFGPEEGWVELHNAGKEPLSLRDHYLVARDRGGTTRWNFGDRDALKPGGYRVFQFPRRTWTPPPPTDDLEELERRELAEREGRLGARFRGFDPEGGFFALVSMERFPEDRPSRGDDDREREERILDFYFYGRQTPGFSYGRLGDGFSFLKPTPGSTNSSPSFQPPPLLANGGAKRMGDSLEVTVVVTGICSKEIPREIQLHYRSGENWKQVPLKIEAAGADREAWGILALARGTIPAGDVSQEFEYYFVARSPAGLERFAPLTAPRDAYHPIIPLGSP